jgi:hypothetical protein
MRLNAEFDRWAAVQYRSARWIASPMAGVERIMLDRVGAEVARATSLVRYAPGSHFSRHEHARGEEVLVLEGTFSDESGDYAPGSYVRNPPGSGHAPWSEPGCVIFVKLRQFAQDDLTPRAIDSRTAAWQEVAESGGARLPLHRHASEEVRLERLPAERRLELADLPKGAELLVIEGALSCNGEHYETRDWLRSPPGASLAIESQGGAEFYLKTGHLPPEQEA